jgi:hypothetical protein
MSKKSDISYTGVILVEEDRDALLVAAGHRENEKMIGWVEVGHHVTLHTGPAPAEIQPALGNVEIVEVTHFGALFFENGTGIAAVKVKLPEHLTCKNDTPHITVARHADVKPKTSNEIVEWVPVETRVLLRGIVTEVPFPKREPMKS